MNHHRSQTKIRLVVILIACLVFLAGCWGKQEVEELAPILGIGLDLGEKPGTVLITPQIASPKKGDPSSGAVIEGRTFSVEASSSREAVEKISKITSRIPFMGSLRVIVIGEDLAKAGGFNDSLDFAQRLGEFRRTTYIVLAKGTARDILNLELRSGLLPAMAIKSSFDSGESISSFPTVRLGHYFTIMGDGITAPIFPVVEGIKSGIKSGKGIEYKAEGDGPGEIWVKGAGFLRGDRLEGFLTDEETKGYMWLENYVVNRSLDTAAINEKGVIFGGRTMHSTTKYKVKENNGKMELQYQIKVDVTVDEVMGLKERLIGPEWAELMSEAEKSFAAAIGKECESALKRQRELGLDFLGIGRHIEQKNSAYWKRIKDQWEEELRDFPVSLEIEVKNIHAGISNSSAVNSKQERQE